MMPVLETSQDNSDKFQRTFWMELGAARYERYRHSFIMRVAAVTPYGEGHDRDLAYLWLGGDENLFKYFAFPISALRYLRVLLILSILSLVRSPSPFLECRNRYFST
jgi:hypothetical protein